MWFWILQPDVTSSCLWHFVQTFLDSLSLSDLPVVTGRLTSIDSTLIYTLIILTNKFVFWRKLALYFIVWNPSRLS